MAIPMPLSTLGTDSLSTYTRRPGLLTRFQSAQNQLTVLGRLERHHDPGLSRRARLDVVSFDVALGLEDAYNALLELAARDLDAVMTRAHRIANARQKIGNGIRHAHILRSPPTNSTS